MPPVNTSASGCSTSGSDVLSLGPIVVVSANDMSNCHGVVNVPNFMICGGFVQTLTTQYYATHTYCGGIGVCSGTNSGKGMHLMSSGKLFAKGAGVTYLGCYGMTNTSNTICVQSAPGQNTVHVSC